jgi:3-oxoadipate enol-lactonase
LPKARVFDIDIHYEVSGAGVPIVLIHGLGGSSLDWENQISALAAQHKVITVDLRGHGRSDKPRGPYSIPLFSTDIAALMTTLHIGPAHVIGNSLGGMVAFQLALNWSGLVRSLVVANSSTEFIAQTARERLWLLQREMIIRFIGMRRLAKFQSRRLFPKPDQEPLRHQHVERLAQNDARAYREAMRAVTRGWSVENELENLRCPVLVIAASDDYTAVEGKAAYAARLPQGELLVIHDSRHATPIDQPAEFNKGVISFLARLPEAADRRGVLEKEARSQKPGARMGRASF